MKEVNYNPNNLSHHNENIQYWVTQGIVINDERYSVEEFFIRSGGLYGIITKDKITYYEYQLSTNVSQNNYDDGELRKRIERLETKPDNSYDDTVLSNRIIALENKEDSKYNNISERIKILENSPDKDNQVLSIEDHTISISNGNSIVIPSYPKYDDSNIKSRLGELESRKTILSLNGNILSVSNGNSVDLSFSKSAYDIWLELGNKGSKQDFINSLKGSKGERGDKGAKGDVTDIGINAVRTYIVNTTNSDVPVYTDNPHYRTLTWNSKTEFGNLHLDILPRVNTGINILIGNIPEGAPKPHTLIEISVQGSNASGVGQIWIETDGKIRCNNLKQGIRYTVDLFGYFR